MVIHLDSVARTANTITMIHGCSTSPAEDGLSCIVLGLYHHPEKVMQLHWSTMSFTSLAVLAPTAKSWATCIPLNCRVIFFGRGVRAVLTIVCRSQVA